MNDPDFRRDLKRDDEYARWLEDDTPEGARDSGFEQDEPYLHPEEWHV